MFSLVKDDLQGVLMNKVNLACVWSGPGRVIFSFARRGQGMSAHFSSDKKGLRHIKAAINDFCVWIFENYRWCRMIFAMITKPSVERLVKKCLFTYLARQNDIRIYVRLKPWAV